MDKRVCNSCGEEKPVSEMVKSARYKGGYMPLCKKCRADYWRERFASNEEARRSHVASVKRSQRKKAYGFGEQGYRYILETMQGGKCALCGCETHGRSLNRYESWDIDHDPKTDIVRGVLCHSCNTSLGHYVKMLEMFGAERLAEYLARRILPDDLPIEPPYHGKIDRANPVESRRSQSEKMSKLSEDQVRAILGDPRPYREIAKEYGIHKQYVASLKSGKKRVFMDIDPDEIIKAAKGPRRKLTKLQVFEIRASNEPQSVLAARYNVSQSLISRIQKGEAEGRAA